MTEQIVLQEPKELLTVKPQLFTKIKKLGAFDVTACMNCGVCTASCPLSVSGNEFPRKLIRYAILGLKDKVLSRPEPWLCYYCGDCSQTCPSQADPGRFMMAVRRYAIIEYSIGKIGKIFYSKSSAIVSYMILAFLGIVGITLGLLFLMDPELPPFWDFTYIPSSFNPYRLISYDFIHYSGMFLGAVIFGIAFIHALIMLNYLRKGSRTPSDVSIFKKISSIIIGFIKIAVGEGIFEKSFNKCDSKARYSTHMAIFYGYVLTFIATSLMFIADIILTLNLPALLGLDSYLFYHENVKPFSKVFGFVGGILLIVGAGYYVYIRMVKKNEYSEHSHFSDWAFLLLTFVIGLTGFFMDVFIGLDWLFTYLGIVNFLQIPMLMLAYLGYAIHLVLVFILIMTAAFTKFAHMEYRLLAIWYNEYQKLIIPSS
ncbi:MAG: 4Fe-4S dicluster domain-containing protein [Candidatus Hermodarchaeota archaeon]